MIFPFSASNSRRSNSTPDSIAPSPILYILLVCILNLLFSSRRRIPLTHHISRLNTLVSWKIKDRRRVLRSRCRWRGILILGWCWIRRKVRDWFFLHNIGFIPQQSTREKKSNWASLIVIPIFCYTCFPHHDVRGFFLSLYRFLLFYFYTFAAFYNSNMILIIQIRQRSLCSSADTSTYHRGNLSGISPRPDRKQKSCGKDGVVSLYIVSLSSANITPLILLSLTHHSFPATGPSQTPSPTKKPQPKQ